jgi:hypothetical protein
MNRLATASALLAVLAGGYAILMLSNGQSTDFDVSASVCAVGSLGATLFKSLRAVLSLPLLGTNTVSPPDVRRAHG